MKIDFNEAINTIIKVVMRLIIIATIINTQMVQNSDNISRLIFTIVSMLWLLQSVYGNITFIKEKQ